MNPAVRGLRVEPAPAGRAVDSACTNRLRRSLPWTVETARRDTPAGAADRDRKPEGATPPPHAVNESTAGTVMVFAAAAGFGTIGVFGEAAAGLGLPLRTLLPARFALATAAVFAVARTRGWSLPAARRDRLAALALGVVYTLMTLAFFSSLRWLTAGLATLVLYTYPALVVLLSAPTLGESITRRTLAALVAATVGSRSWPAPGQPEPRRRASRWRSVRPASTPSTRPGAGTSSRGRRHRR